MSDDGKKFRITWEVVFYVIMSEKGFSLEFETLRIKYFCSEKGKTRNYIVDFIDHENKIVYEIKPKCNVETTNALTKQKFLNAWCARNGYTKQVISNDWFDKTVSEYYLHLTSERCDIDYGTVKRRMKQFL